MAFVLLSRLKRHWWILLVGGLLACYALAGFVLAPWLLERQVISFAATQFEREASIGRIGINPFALSLRMHDLLLKDADDSRLASLDELHVNFSAMRSLRQRAWTFSDIRLGAPYLKLVRDQAGVLNLLRLLESEAPAEEVESQGLPRLMIGRLALEDGIIDWRDEVPKTPFETRVGPLGIGLDNFGTLPETAGAQQTTVIFESGARLKLSGELGLAPLLLRGHVDLQGPVLGPAARYWRDELPFVVEHDKTALAADFLLEQDAKGDLQATVDGLALSISELRLSAPEAGDFLAWKKLQLGGGSFSWSDAVLDATALQLDGLRLRLRRDAEGEIDLQGLLLPGSAAESGTEHVTDGQVAILADGGAALGEQPSAATDGAEAPLQARLGRFLLQDAAIAFTDALPGEAVDWSLEDMRLELQDISNEPGAQLPLTFQARLGSGGELGLEGELGVLPVPTLKGQLRLQEIQLAQLQPYLAALARVGLESGLLDVAGQLASGDDETLAFKGDATVRGLALRDAVEDAPLLAWRELGIDGLELQLDGQSLRMRRLRLHQPFARLFINQDQSTNIGALLVDAPADEAAGSAAPEISDEPMHLHVGNILIDGAEVDFTDLSLPLPFAAHIAGLEGELSTIDSRSRRPAKIDLEGGVAPYGLVRVNGRVRVNAPTELADIDVLFRNIEMATLSPYTVKFAGRKIAAGKLDLDLRYQLDERQLVGSNNVVIEELTLGEKVPSPGAANLPLGLAVALLKDASGRIKVDMPVEGSLDDPKFRIGGVLWDAFRTLVMRVASAPFRMLGRLLGVESEDLGRIEFAPGEAGLLPPGREKLAQIAEALAQRPELGVSVPAVVAPQLDIETLRHARIAERLAQALDSQAASLAGDRLERRRREVLEMFYAERFPDEDLAGLRETYRRPPADDAAGRSRLDWLAYAEELRGQLAATEEISPAELDALAAARMETIMAELHALGVDAGRVREGARGEAEPVDARWVPVELGVEGMAD